MILATLFWTCWRFGLPFVWPFLSLEGTFGIPSSSIDLPSMFRRFGDGFYCISKKNTTLGTKLRMPKYFNHGKAFPDTHSKIPLDSHIYTAKSIGCRVLEPPKSNFQNKQNNLDSQPMYMSSFVFGGKRWQVAICRCMYSYLYTYIYIYIHIYT